MTSACDVPSSPPAATLHPATPRPTSQAAVSGHLANTTAQNCGGLWDARRVCFHGYRHYSGATQHPPKNPTPAGPQSAGETGFLFLIRIVIHKEMH